MSAKSAKNKPAEPSVLGSLPASRPERLGRERPAPKPRAAAAPQAAAAKRAPKAPRPARRPAPKRPPEPPPAPRRTGPPSGPELVTTTVKAAGELAQIGVTFGVHLAKRVARRIPRP